MGYLVTIQPSTSIPDSSFRSRPLGRRTSRQFLSSAPLTRRPSLSFLYVHQRLLNFFFLVLFYAFCQRTTRVLQESSCALRRLSVRPQLSNGALGGSTPRSAKEYFLQSFVSSSNKASFSSDGGRSILSEDDPNHPILVLYVGLPEETPYLQCALCTQPHLTKALERDNFVYLGTCPYECDQLLSRNASDNQTLNEGRYFARGNPLAFFTSSQITEPRAENSTLGLVPHTLEMSQAHGRRRNIPQLEVDFMIALDAVRHSGRNALLIHSGASLWGAKHIRSLSAFLKLHHWQVHVVIGPYRPLHDYYADISYAYVQDNFLNSYAIRLWPNMRAGEDYLGWETLHDSTLNDLEDLLRESFAFDGHPMEIVRHNFGMHFPNTHYVVVPNPSCPRSASTPCTESRRAAESMQHIFCAMLGLDQACSASSRLVDVPTPPSAQTSVTDTWVSLQLDAMAVKAWEMGWLPGPLSQRGSRLTVRRHLEDHVRQSNISAVTDFPLICWSKKTLRSMQNISCHFERRISPSGSLGCLMTNSSMPTPEAQYVRNRAYVASPDEHPPHPPLVNPHLFCYVNVPKLFQDPHWKSFFESLPFQRRRPQDDDDEDDASENEEEESKSSDMDSGIHFIVSHQEIE